MRQIVILGSGSKLFSSNPDLKILKIKKGSVLYIKRYLHPLPPPRRRGLKFKIGIDVKTLNLS